VSGFSTRIILLAATALLAAGIGMAPAARAAKQTDEASDNTAIEEIIVTTRKRAENIQTVPLSITAFTATDIEDAGITGVEDVALLTPGFTISPLFGNAGAVTPVIRGLSQTIGEPNVGFFIDGVYQSSRAVMQALLGNSIERIEVAKGPQSALYGRNTFGGAINYVTKRPSNEFESTAEVTAGDSSRFNLRAAISGPIIEDQVFFRLAYMHSERDGYFTNELTGKPLDNRNTEVYAGTIQTMPGDNIDVTFRIAYEDTNDGDDPLQFATNNAIPAAIFGFPVPVNQLYRGKLPNFTSGFAFTPGYLKRQNLTDSLIINWDVGGATISAITGYNDLKVKDLTDDDYSARAIHQTLSIIDQYELSQELRVTSTGESRLRWMGGGYFYHLNATTTTDGRNVGEGAALQAALGAFGLPFIGTKSLLSVAKEETKNYAGFGQLQFDITSQLTSTFSARYSHEKKSVNAVDTTPGGPSNTFIDQVSDNSFTPRFALNFQITDDAMTYASVAKAVKSGGFNVVTTAGGINDNEREYHPERSWNYEVGAKTSWFDNRLIFNAAAFYIRWTNQIVRALGGPTGTAVLNVNAGQTTSKGLELEMTARPIDGLDIRGGFSYTDAAYDDFDFTTLRLIGITQTQLAGTRLQYNSKYTANGTIQYRTPIYNSMDWFGRFDVMYQSSQSAVQTADAFTGDRTLVNVRTGLETQRFSLTFWVDNLFKNRVANNGVFVPDPARRFDAANALPTLFGIPGFGPIDGFEAFAGLVLASPPRTWGITARARF
jgi:iron complex outermembrane receptor protein